MSSVTHRPGPMAGRRPLLSCTPAHAVCPCLLSAALARRGSCTTLPAAPLPPPRSLETCPFCFSILPLLFLVVMGSGPQRRKGLPGPGPRSQRLLVSEPLAASLPDPHGLRGPLPASPSTASLTGSLGGGLMFVCFSAKQQQQSIELREGVALF